MNHCFYGSTVLSRAFVVFSSSIFSLRSSSKLNWTDFHRSRNSANEREKIRCECEKSANTLTCILHGVFSRIFLLFLLYYLTTLDAIPKWFRFSLVYHPPGCSLDFVPSSTAATAAFTATTRLVVCLLTRSLAHSFPFAISIDIQISFTTHIGMNGSTDTQKVMNEWMNETRTPLVFTIHTITHATLLVICVWLFLCFSALYRDISRCGHRLHHHCLDFRAFELILALD